MFRFVAPAGAPIEIPQILRSLRLWHSRNETGANYFESVARTLRVHKVLGACSGRSALTLILKALHHLRPDRDVVALPAYTCFTVAASIVRAGLKLYPVDILPETLDFEPSQLAALPQRDLLCIVTSNLFGLVNDIDRLKQVAQARGAFLVDDAAQALGATLRGYPAGTLGDVGFYSFGRGKALAAIEGALIVTNSDEIAALIQDETEKLSPSSAFHSATLLVQMLAYAVFLTPRLYWFPNSLAFLKLGATEFDPTFAAFRMPALVRKLLLRLMEKLDEFNRIRRENASALARALEHNASFTIPRPAADCVPNYVRFPLIARDEATRDRAVRELRAAGIGASPFYPGAICDIDSAAPYMAIREFHCPKAENLSRRLLTVPTHPYVQRQDVATIAKALGRL
jgi:dTDP-4-amino-4,6-dideoxygalactose transaminase